MGLGAMAAVWIYQLSLWLPLPLPVSALKLQPEWPQRSSVSISRYSTGLARLLATRSVILNTGRGLHHRLSRNDHPSAPSADPPHGRQPDTQVDSRSRSHSRLSTCRYHELSSSLLNNPGLFLIYCNVLLNVSLH
jgi:hypothetical protein